MNYSHLSKADKGIKAAMEKRGLINHDKKGRRFSNKRVETLNRIRDIENSVLKETKGYAKNYRD